MGAELEVLLGDLTIGTLLVGGQHEGGATLARFTPGSDYAKVAPLFEEFEDAVSEVSLHAAGDVADRIEALLPSLRLPSGSSRERVYDLQIFRDGGASFRTEENR